MSKFTFRLQSVLNLKMQVEDSLENELSKAIRRLEEEKGILATIEIEMDSRIQDVNRQSVHGIAVEKLREFNSYLSLLRKKSLLQKENINNAEQNVDKYREELLKVSQQRQMFEKLKEKTHREFLQEENKLEQRLIDERISYNYSKI